MSYEPTLLIKKIDIINKHDDLVKMLYSKDELKISVSRYILEVGSHSVNFDGIDIVVCQPELTSFNKSVRNSLSRLDIYYVEDN